MTTEYPDLPPKGRYSPADTYKKLGISYSSLKNYTRQGRMDKEYWPDGTPYYSGETINNFWLFKRKLETPQLKLNR